MARVEIVTAASDKQPFPVEAVVLEEDTYRVMSAANRITHLPETTESSLDELKEFTPHVVGELIGRGNRLYAIVHDFEMEPSFNDEGACQALARLAELARERGFEQIAIQAFQGSPDEASHAWIQAEIQRVLAGSPVKRVWLIVP